MTSQNRRRRVVGALACGVVAGALFAGIGAPTAIAAPGDDTTDTEAPKMTGEQALAIIQQDYDLGAGGGQLSNYVHEVLALRDLGFRPSKANQTAIAEALEKRPNQAPLVEALKATVSYQRRIQAQAQAQQQGQGGNGFSIGGAPAPFDQGSTIMPYPG
jgi:hypothetical protein